MANRLKNLEKNFKQTKITKGNYIQKASKMHQVLWEYSDYLRDRNIGTIEISNKQVLFTVKNGVRIVCDSKDQRAAPIEILNFKDYESEELRMMKRLLQNNDVVLDIGANIGWYSLNLALSVPRGRVIAFEPIPQIYTRLKKNIAINNVKNIATYNFGLSDQKGSFKFYYDPTLSVASSLRDLYKDRKKAKVNCKVKRLDDLSSKMTKKINFIKCDVEGAELFVVQGGLKTIEKNKPIIFLEMLRKWSAKFGYHPNDIIAILSEVGYSTYCAKNNKLKKIKSVTEKTKATNFYFLHDKKHKGFIQKLVKK